MKFRVGPFFGSWSTMLSARAPRCITWTDHLRDVLHEVRGLAHGEKAEERYPGCRDEPVPIARSARGHH